MCRRRAARVPLSDYIHCHYPRVRTPPTDRVHLVHAIQSHNCCSTDHAVRAPPPQRTIAEVIQDDLAGVKILSPWTVNYLIKNKISNTSRRSTCRLVCCSCFRHRRSRLWYHHFPPIVILPVSGSVSGSSRRKCVSLPVRDSFVSIFFISQITSNTNRIYAILWRYDDDAIDDRRDDRRSHNDDHDHGCCRRVREPDNAEILLNPTRRLSAQRIFTRIRCCYWYIIILYLTGTQCRRCVDVTSRWLDTLFLLTTFYCTTFILLPYNDNNNYYYYYYQ